MFSVAVLCAEFVIYENEFHILLNVVKALIRNLAIGFEIPILVNIYARNIIITQP